MRSCRTPSEAYRGFTLVELVISLVIVAVAGVTLVTVMAKETTGTVPVEERARAVEAARSLIEEVLVCAFEDPEGPPGSFGSEEADRTAFDDLDDFDGWVDRVPLGGPAPAGASAWLERRVEVCNVSPDDLEIEAPPGSSDFKRVKVTVPTSSGPVLLLALRGNR